MDSVGLPSTTCMNVISSSPSEMLDLLQSFQTVSSRFFTTFTSHTQTRYEYADREPTLSPSNDPATLGTGDFRAG